MLHAGITRLLRAIVGSALLCVLTACSGGGSDAGSSGGSASGSGDGSNAGSPPMAPTLSLASRVKQVRFSWNAVSDATHYKIYQNPDGASGFTQVDGDITATSHDLDIAVHRLNWSAARYLLEACNAAGCAASNEVSTLGAVLQAIGYFKASNTEANDNFAVSLALSGDGDTLAVGAPGESSGAAGVGGDQASSPAASGAGAVYIFARIGGAWSQQAYVKASNTRAGAAFGISVSLSGDGDTLAVGAFLEDSPGTGIDGDQGGIADNSSNAGAVYVFARSGGSWSQQAYVKASNTHAGASFGGAVSLSGDGNTLAVGASGEDTGALDAGAVYVFARSASVWSQQAFVKASNIQTSARFGSSVALSGEGSTLAVGAHGESSGATGVDGDQSDNLANSAGAVYVLTRSASVWSQQAYVKASNTAAGDAFGSSVALSSDGNTLAVGAGAEASASTGINGDQTDNSTSNSGAVYVFTRSTDTWSQQAYVKPSSTAGGSDFFGGTSVALSSDGGVLAVGAIGEDGAATGIGGDQTDRRSFFSGAVYFYTRSAGAWSQQSYVKASNTTAGDTFGRSLALSSDGNMLAVGAPGESSAATGINGDQTDNSTTGAGAVYLY